jgi:ATP-dependent Clp protease ATP-binding subunit ClpA
MQQSLAADAAAVMRQAVSAARRRGHAQVTPLHVASAILSSDSAAGAGLLRAACLRSRSSTPLQCKALEFCLNVALSRLATTGGAHHPAAAFGGFQHRAASPQPALSNALAAAFKRAQPSQRRGGSSSQGRQQQGAVNEIELEQLVVSILDDPSVSRVMREAGFSSAEVKAHVSSRTAAPTRTAAPSTAVSSRTAAPTRPRRRRRARPRGCTTAAKVQSSLEPSSR